LGEAVLGLGVNTRVLMIGAHPDDEDTFLISWLSRGRQVETAYLSLTRGDGGQNLIGNELGEALGVIRTEELLAARRVDGAQQYFTRAYDFGFSKDTVDTYAHWPKDSILGDIIRVVRTLRPHVIIGVFSGTTRDGHGQHQVSGLLAREAYDLSGDTLRFPEDTHGPAWLTAKFYRAARFNAASGTLRFDVGEYSPLRGRSYAEIAGESRSQHKSQGFGALERKGPVIDLVRREASRVNGSVPPENERGLFDGIDTSWARFRSPGMDASARAAIDSLAGAFRAVRAAYNPLTPNRLIQPLATVQRLLGRVCREGRANACERQVMREGRTVYELLNADLVSSLLLASQRVSRAIELASGVETEAFAQRELVPSMIPTPVVTYVYNRGADTVRVSRVSVQDDMIRPWADSAERVLPPGGVLQDTAEFRVRTAQPWWLARGRIGAMFVDPANTTSETEVGIGPYAGVAVHLARVGEPLRLVTPIVYRFADQVKGEVRRSVAAAPAITLAFGEQAQYAPANVAIERDVTIQLRSANDGSGEVRVTLSLPNGLAADSTARSVALAGYGAQGSVTFRVRGRLAPGTHRISALAERDGETYATGYELIEYDHIRARRTYRPAASRIVAVDVRVPPALKVAYVTGVSDNVAPSLAQLGIPVTVIPAADVGTTNLAPYTTVVIGPRAYEAHPELVAANPRLLDFARRGGTLVVQYGQYEMTQPGIMPYPITINRPHDRVTHEDAPVTILDARAPELLAPNPITDADFGGWVQERSLYMPRTMDERYRSLLALSDPGEPPNRGAILVAPLGDGMYVYTTLALFRQLPAGVPGAARLFVNLLSAGRAGRVTP
jgi:LmbE family N-acetylglucosaminyl deacetylase